MVGKNEDREEDDVSDSIILLDTLTLDKVSEFKEKTFNSEHSKEDDDCKTSHSFPKYVLWGQGAYLLVGIETENQSKVYYELKVYDWKTKDWKTTIKRLSRLDLGGCILKVNNHPSNDNILVFTIKNSTTEYSVVEFNVIKNSMVK